LFDAAQIAASFLQARALDRLANRAVLERVQARRIERLIRHLNRSSPFYRTLGAQSLQGLPILSKSEWLSHFDTINTAGVTYDQAIAFAAQQERDRTFSNTLNGLTIGLSTGTSGRRGVFLVSKPERLTWLGVMLAKLVPDDPLKRRKVAFLLRAGSPLYETAHRGPIQFQYFDMLQPWSDLKQALGAFVPDMLIAPAGVLRQLADEGLPAGLRPARVISVAECLYPDDEAAIVNAFGVRPGEVYQATEGLIATRCEHGTLHLNEAYLHIEKDWIDSDRTHFMPIVTDFLRRTQPIVRYRLDDILAAGAPCACGRAAETISTVEGRRDDVCHLLAPNGAPVPVFPDHLVRAILGAAPTLSLFRLVQTAPGAFVIETSEAVPEDAIRSAFAALAAKLEAMPPSLTLSDQISPDLKRRRVVNRSQPPPHPPAAI
jgi:putative adenylate-forming enzyme